MLEACALYTAQCSMRALPSLAYRKIARGPWALLGPVPSEPILDLVLLVALVGVPPAVGGAEALLLCPHRDVSARQHKVEPLSVLW